jgi:chemotaxis signal transduction protein
MAANKIKRFFQVELWQKIPLAKYLIKGVFNFRKAILILIHYKNKM